MASACPQAHPSKLLQPIAQRREYGSWGGYPRVSHESVFRPQWTDEMETILRRAGDGSLLAYGLGRSYGDCCLNKGRSLIDCSRLDRFLDADFQEGWIRCEAGTSLAAILQMAVPRGWFLPVTPGTKFVTVGGAIANDVHGKNHHRAGTFGGYVRKMAVYRSDCGLVMCSPEVNSELFRATIGGLGLTGVIAWAEIQLRPIAGPYMAVESIPFHSLEEFLQLTRQSDGVFEYTVAWIDCLSSGTQRGIFLRANHSLREGLAHPHRVRLCLPFSLPACTMNRFTIKAFNAAYYFSKRHKSGISTLPYDAFFYPLDALEQWNRVYGRRGFLQYQCVVPQAAMAEVLRLIAHSEMGSFLAVLKQFGACSSPGMLSFPRPGLTVALDFPMRGEPTLQLFRRLDRIVAEAGGALYPAKDACMTPEMFAASFPNWRNFRVYVDDKLSSSLWRRVTERA
jgi:FAD/FMN-containing dehydrogenase